MCVCARVCMCVVHSPSKEHVHAHTYTHTQSQENSDRRSSQGPHWTLGTPTQSYLALPPTLHLHCVLETCPLDGDQSLMPERWGGGRGKGPDQLQVTDPVPRPGLQERNADANIWLAQGHPANPRTQNKGLHRCGTSKPPPCKLPPWASRPRNPTVSGSPPGLAETGRFPPGGRSPPQAHWRFPRVLTEISLFCLQRKLEN